MGKYCKKHIGEKYKTYESLGGYYVEIIDGGNKPGYCIIRFSYPIIYEREISMCSVKKGSVKNLYHPSTHNVGYFGLGKYKSKHKNKFTKCYLIWKSMMARCYSSKYQNKYPTYKNVVVCRAWHNYQIFAEWFEENYIEGYELDKDILSGNQKIYSPETCCFIPKKLNKFMANIQSSNTSGCIGVHWHKYNNKWIANIRINNKLIHLGYYTDIKEAENVYKKARKIEAEKWKIKSKELGLDQRIIDNIR